MHCVRLLTASTDKSTFYAYVRAKEREEERKADGLKEPKI